MKSNAIKAALQGKQIREVEIAESIGVGQPAISSVIQRRIRSRRIAERICELIEKPMTEVFPEYGSR